LEGKKKLATLMQELTQQRDYIKDLQTESTRESELARNVCCALTEKLECATRLRLRVQQIQRLFKFAL